MALGPGAEQQLPTAEALARDLPAGWLTPTSGTTQPLTLMYTRDRLEVRPNIEDDLGAVYADFLNASLVRRTRQVSRRGERLLRAVLGARGKPNAVVDATAGLGRDAFLLASWGCTVHLIERSPVVWALLADGLRRAGQDPATAPIVARMTLEPGEAAKVLARLGTTAAPDVVYLDPMHPRRRRSALNGRAMRVLRQVVGEDDDAADLLAAALARARRRVVVKRPRRAEPIAGPRPSDQIAGPNTRFDIYRIP